MNLMQFRSTKPHKNATTISLACLLLLVLCYAPYSVHSAPSEVPGSKSASLNASTSANSDNATLVIWLEDPANETLTSTVQNVNPQLEPVSSSSSTPVPQTISTSTSAQSSSSEASLTESTTQSLVLSANLTVSQTTTSEPKNPVTSASSTELSISTSAPIPESLTTLTSEIPESSSPKSPDSTSSTTSEPTLSTEIPKSPSSSSPIPISSSEAPPKTSSLAPSETESVSPSSTSAVPESVPSENSSNTTESSSLSNETLAVSANQTESINATTTTVSPLLLTESQLEALAGNASKFVIKYITKVQNATKTYTKYFFKKKSDGTNETKTETKFWGGFMSKNLSIEPEPIKKEEPKGANFQDFMPDDIRQNGGVVVHVILLVYVCLSLGIICDLYFLTSIEYIGNTLNLPADIAGATFMAFGTSAPELFIALIGVFIAEDDIGTSTILGSAVFNLIFVPSVCGFAIYLSGMKYPKINKYSILRDAIFYIIAITILMLSLKDNEIDWVESVAMLSTYCIYMTILYYNSQLGELIEEDEEEESDTTSTSTDECYTESNSNEQTPLLRSRENSFLVQFSRSERSQNFTKSADWHHLAHMRGMRKGSILHAAPISRTNSIRTSSIRNGSILNIANNSHAYLPIGEEKNSAKPPKKILPQHEEPHGMPENWAESHILLRILMFPVVLLIKLSVPRPNKYNYFLTFIISILWISGFTYAAVYLVTIIGHTFNLPETVLGLTILAAGSSIPEVISSVIVVKRAGLANMALCNLFGSNIFDILVCLGLPWLLKQIISMVRLGTIEMALTVVPVQSNGLLLTTFTLMVCVVSFVFTLGLSGWKMGLPVGISCSIIYFTAITLATLYEIMLN